MEDEGGMLHDPRKRERGEIYGKHKEGLERGEKSTARWTASEKFRLPKK